MDQEAARELCELEQKIQALKTGQVEELVRAVEFARRLLFNITERASPEELAALLVPVKTIYEAAIKE